MVGMNMNPSTDSSSSLNEPGVEWHLLAELATAADAMTGVAYLMRIMGHMLAVGDHRHLAAFARDLDNALTALEPVDVRLTEVATEAAVAWGMDPAGWNMTELVAKAPTEVALPLTHAVEELLAISRELKADGAVAEELVEGAVQLISKRRSEMESGGPALTYSPGSALRAGTLTA
jgi:hypothetical protein